MKAIQLLTSGNDSRKAYSWLYGSDRSDSRAVERLLRRLTLMINHESRSKLGPVVNAAMNYTKDRRYYTTRIRRKECTIAAIPSEGIMWLLLNEHVSIKTIRKSTGPSAHLSVDERQLTR
jgi:hypothetical protein